MTSSTEHQEEPEAVLSAILDLLSEKRMRRLIAVPIDAVAIDFLENVDPPLSRDSFNRVVAAFMQRIHAEALPLRRELSPEAALSEAVSLLEKGSLESGAGGYVPAELAALDPEGDGVYRVLAWLAEAVKFNERRKYIEYVYATRFGFLDWNLQVAVTEAYLKRIAYCMPESLAGRSAAQLAGEFPALILGYLRTDALLEPPSPDPVEAPAGGIDVQAGSPGHGKETSSRARRRA